MGKSRNYQAHVIIVKQSKFGEFDKLLTAFSLEFGKIRAIAKGAYRPGSKLGGNVEPLTYSLIMLARGRNLDIIQQSQCIDGFSSLKSDLWLNSCSLYLLELVDSFTVQNSENKSLFNLLVDTLNTLKTGEMTENILRYFEIIMLNFLGFRPQLYNCVICDSLIQPVVNYFSPSSGGIICPNCRHSDFNSETISVDALKVLRF